MVSLVWMYFLVNYSFLVYQKIYVRFISPLRYKNEVINIQRCLSVYHLNFKLNLSKRVAQHNFFPSKKKETEIFPTQKGTFANYTISMYYLQHIRIYCNSFESFPYAWFVSIIHLSYQFTSVCVSLIISGNLFWHSFVLTVYTNPKLLSLRTPYKHELNFSVWRSNCKLQ